MMWIAHFNSHFERSVEALVYSNEKVVCTVITQSIKCFLEKRNSRSIFLDEEKKIIPNFFSSLISSQTQKCLPISQKFQKNRRNSKKFKKHTRKIFQIVKNEGKFFACTTEISNKIYKNFNL